MKRLIIIGLIFLFCLGVCVAADASDRWQDHDSLYASWEHMKFSLWGYKDAKMIDVYRSKWGGWWGAPVYVERVKCK